MNSGLESAPTFEELVDEKPAKLSASWQVVDRLRVRYAAPQYAFFEQVRNGTGFTGNRSVDAVALSLWPSRGLDLLGFEVKVSRSDWLRELKKPEKAEDTIHQFDQWYIVAGDAKIVGPGELPKGWGLMVPHAGGLKVAVEAERREAEVGRPFIAALLRVVSETYITREGLEAKVRAAREDEKAGAKHDVDRAQEETRQLRRQIQAFEQRVGVSFPREDYSWAKPSLEDFSRAFRATLLAEKVQDETARALARTADGLRLSLETVERVINGIPKAEPEPEEDQE